MRRRDKCAFAREMRAALPRIAAPRSANMHVCSRRPDPSPRAAVTMPIDVVKTRLQNDGHGGPKMYNGAVDCGKQMVRAEGIGALFKGLPPALVRQSTYGSLRYGLYGPIKGKLGIQKGEPVPLWKKIAAGGAAGAIASAIANPTDLLKVRLQTDGQAKGADGKLLPKQYNGMVDCFTKTLRNEGALALWTGVGPTVGRATVLAAAELATYDEVKSQLLGGGYMQDGLPCHIVTATCSGFVATVASSPFDVVKSRVMGQPVRSRRAFASPKGRRPTDRRRERGPPRATRALGRSGRKRARVASSSAAAPRPPPAAARAGEPRWHGQELFWDGRLLHQDVGQRGADGAV